MKNRSIENYLSDSDKELVQTFIEKSIRRFKTHERRKGMPSPWDTDEINKLYMKKHLEWDNAVKTQILGEGGMFLGMIRNTDVSNPCAIENFLNSFKTLIEQKEKPCELRDMLTVLEKGLRDCGFSCPCPAEPH